MEAGVDEKQRDEDDDEADESTEDLKCGLHGTSHYWFGDGLW